MISGMLYWMKEHPYLTASSVAVKYGVTGLALLTATGQQLTQQAMEKGGIVLSVAWDTLLDLLIHGGGP